METKKCKICGEEKPIEKFVWNKRKDGTRSYRDVCMKCKNESRKEYQKEWYKEVRNKKRAEREVQQLIDVPVQILIAELMTRGYKVEKS